MVLTPSIATRPGERAPRPMGRRGFTLVEVLITLAIIVVLAGLLFVALNLLRGVGRRLQCLGNQQQFGNAVLQFAHEHGGDIPTKNDLKYGRNLYGQSAGTSVWPLRPYFEENVANNLEESDRRKRKLLRCPEVLNYFVKNYDQVFYSADWEEQRSSSFAFNACINSYPLSYLHTGNNSVAAGGTTKVIFNLRQMNSLSYFGFTFCGNNNWNQYNNDMEGADPNNIHFPHGYTSDDPPSATALPRLVGGKVNVWYLDGHANSLKERKVVSSAWVAFHEKSEVVTYKVIPNVVTSTSSQYGHFRSFVEFWGSDRKTNTVFSFDSY